MTRTDAVVLVVTGLVLCVIMGFAIDAWLLTVDWWPLVGKNWRAWRRPVPLQERPLRGDVQGWESSADRGRYALAGGRSLESGSLSPRLDGETPAGATASRATMSADEWEQLDADDQAETLIAEWHDDTQERWASHTDQFAALGWGDMPWSQREGLIQWDFKVKADRVLEEFAAWREQFMAEWQAMNRAELELRRAA